MDPQPGYFSSWFSSGSDVSSSPSTPPANSSLLATGYDIFSRGLGAAKSAVTTVHNETSDDAALRKLGFPLTSLEAVQQLERAHGAYYFINKNKDNLQFQDFEVASRRTKYVMRAFIMLLNGRGHEKAIVKHCKLYHQAAMFPCLLNQFDNLVERNIAEWDAIKNIKGQEQITHFTYFEENVCEYDKLSSLCKSVQNCLYDTSDKNELEILMQSASVSHAKMSYNHVLESTETHKIGQVLQEICEQVTVLTKAFCMLSGDKNRLEKAEFLLKNYEQGMPFFLQETYKNFINKEKMILEKEQLKKIFGNIDVGIIDEGAVRFHFGKASETVEDIKRLSGLKNIIFLKQSHGSNGRVITDNNCNADYSSQEGDFLVTDLPGIGLGIRTADCVPMIFYDYKHKAIGIVHAGRKGIIANIVDALFKCMERNYKTESGDLAVIFGPAIRSCCYQFQQDKVSSFPADWQKGTEIIERDGVIYLDLIQIIKNKLSALGINKFFLNGALSKCTKCSDGYYSHRGGCQKEERQLSYVWMDKKLI